MVTGIPSSNSSSVSPLNIKEKYPKDPFPIEEVGGKAYNLHKLETLKSISIPPWVAIQALFFREYLAENGIIPMIDELEILCANQERNRDLIRIKSEKIQNAIIQSKMNKQMAGAIEQAFEMLKKKTGFHARFAIRSSGVMEDSSISSCAGLYDSLLNLQRTEDVIESVKKVWASSFNLRIVNERIRLGLRQQQCMMGVIIQELIQSHVSGVASTIVLGNNYPGTQISASFGLGVGVVDGEISPDSWVLHEKQNCILEKFRGSKNSQVCPTSTTDTITIPVKESLRSFFCLTENEIQELGQKVADIKSLYNCEMDVEFAFDENHRLFILQARPLVAIQSETNVIDLESAADQEPVVRGNFSVPGVSSGRLVFIPDWESLASGKIKLCRGDIAMAYVTTNTWSQHLANIGGLITCEGSPSSHPILLSREKGIPCVIGMTEEAFKKLLALNGTPVTIDGHNQRIYQGVIATKKAKQADLMERFSTVKIRPWPDVAQMLPSLIHNKMVLEHDGKYWRKTPTFPIVGFQAEFNLRRFDYVGELIGKPEIKQEARIIDGFVCFPMSSFAEHVAIFNGTTLSSADAFHQSQRKCMKEFIELSSQFEWSVAQWEKYIELSAKFRAYIWLGGALRSFAERKVDEMAVLLEIPRFYLDECANSLQSEIPELDSDMHQEIHDLAIELKEEKYLPSDIMELRNLNHSLFSKVESLAKKYRFEHQISLHLPVDLNFAYKRILREIDHVRSGHTFTTHKNEYKDRFFLPNTELREWLRISIENRLLQSDSHHLDARSKTFMRPKLIELGNRLVEKKILSSAEQIFEASVQQITDYIILLGKT